MKILRPDLVDDEGARRSIAKEGELLRRIDHPYFMRLLAADTDGPAPFIELEFLDGPRDGTESFVEGAASNMKSPGARVILRAPRYSTHNTGIGPTVPIASMHKC